MQFISFYNFSNYKRFSPQLVIVQGFPIFVPPHV